MSTTTSRPRRVRSPQVSPPQTSPPRADQPGDSPSAKAATPTVAPDETNAEDLLLRKLHLTRADRHPCFGQTDGVTKGSKPIDRRAAADHVAELTSEVRRPENRRHLPLLSRLIRRNGRTAAQFKNAPKPAAAFHTESGRTTVMRTDWSSSAAQLAIDWSQPEMKWEFCLGSDVAMQGIAAPWVSVDGRTLDAVGEWEEVIWLSEPEADYLELEIVLTGGTKLQRQILLSRRDGWLMVADDVRPARPAAIECRVQLPTSPGSRLVPAADTREAQLVCGKRKFAAVPGSLPEWRSERSTGEMTLEGDRLSVRASTPAGAALHVPLFLNFDSRRAARELTWRRLTIGENLRIVRPDEAAGYRLQLGREHWLVYRSLTERANRTLLGINLQTDFLFARFSAEGESEPLIEIED